MREQCLSEAGDVQQTCQPSAHQQQSYAQLRTTLPPAPPNAAPHNLKGLQVGEPHVLLGGAPQPLHCLLPVVRLLLGERRRGKASGRSRAK